MAITGYLSNTVQLIGDGTSTTVTVDLVRIVEASSFANRCPVGIYSISGGGTISSSTLVGTLLTVVWATAPSAGVFNLSFALEM